MSDWSLPKLLAGLHHDIERRLATAREAFSHPVTKGDAAENVWRELLQTYLPERYKTEKAHVVDSKGAFSNQIDVVIFDRHYSPFIFNYEEQYVIPAESVYGVFETKQTINAAHVTYAQEKVASVRSLHRTSLPVPHVEGTAPAKTLPHILGGLLTFDSEWDPALGQPLLGALGAGNPAGRLDLGCVAAHGMFMCDSSGCHAVTPGGKPATAFLLELIARLQQLATVPMVDVRAYAKWLSNSS
jgi:Domain of unknown function (DUF6602)